MPGSGPDRTQVRTTSSDADARVVLLVLVLVLVREPVAGLGVEHVHAVRVGRHVDRVALVDLVRPLTRTMTLPGVPSTSQVP